MSWAQRIVVALAIVAALGLAALTARCAPAPHCHRPSSPTCQEHRP